MNTLPTDTFRPKDNHVLVAVPERFIEHDKPGEKRIILPGGDDSFKELYDALINGENCHIEEDPNAHRTPVRTGQVLAVPARLTADMALGPGFGGRPLTCAHITNPVEVGDTVHFEHLYLTDDAEIFSGVYLLPYTALVAVIHQSEPFHLFSKRLKGDYSSPIQFPATIRPLAGYILLSRVWADDVVDETGADGGLVKCRKNAAGLVLQTNVPPLANEGVVAWIDNVPLGGLRGADEVKVGQRLLIDERHALIETIAGTEYIVIRQVHCLGERLPEFSALPVAIDDGFVLDCIMQTTTPEFIERATDGKYHFDESGPLSAPAGRVDGAEAHSLTSSGFGPRVAVPAEHVERMRPLLEAEGYTEQPSQPVPAAPVTV